MRSSEALTAECCDDDAQVAGDRLLAGEDLDGLLVEGHGQLVDLRVVRDDLFGEGHRRWWRKPWWPCRWRP